MTRVKSAYFGAKPRYHESFIWVLLVISAGLLGDVAKDIWWLGVGEKDAWRFIAYLVHAWVAVTVTLIFYGLLRGGLISGPGGAKEINAYGIVGVSGVVGIFAEMVLSKLGGVLT